MRLIRIFIWIAVAFFAWPGFALAFEVQEVTSPKGIKAWLVEARGIPIISMDFSFEGGTSLDPAGREGSASLMASLLTEGAGDKASTDFKAETTRLNMSLYFNSSADYTEGSFSCLSQNCDQALALLKLALTKPRFEAEAFARLQQQTLQSIQQRERDQASLASRLWFAKAFPNHPYGRPAEGMVETVSKLTPQDMQQVHAAVMRRGGLRIGVVGDIDAKALAAKLDDIFGELPTSSGKAEPASAVMAQGPVLESSVFDGPQTFIVFGNPSVAGDSSKGMAAYLMTELMGGSASFARLHQSLREKSGLTYGVSFNDINTRSASFMQGSLSTANETAMQALEKLQAELALMAKDGPTEDELRKVKSYVNGAFPLRFTSNAAISQSLLAAQQLGRGTDFVERRTERVNAVTVADIKAVATEFLKPDKMVVVMVGQPKR